MDHVTHINADMGDVWFDCECGWSGTTMMNIPENCVTVAVEAIHHERNDKSHD